MKLYLDSAYIAKCYLREPGSDAVLDLVESSTIRTSSLLAAVEVSAVFHRHFREGNLSPQAFRKAKRLFESDRENGMWDWIPLTEEIVNNAAAEFDRFARSIFLRSADCLHLVSARHAGFKKIHSNDRHLLAAAPHFNLQGCDVIAGKK